ncbi:cadherin repeat domain-containing protein, partial [Cylindrospermopsis raciborskii CS-506_A]
VGTITPATDPDAGDVLSYTLGGADASKFDFNPTTRVLSFKTAPNFESPGSAAGTNAYTLVVTATDSKNAIATQNITVNVTDVDDTAPVVNANQTFSYAEGKTANFQVGTVTATDAVGVTSFAIASGNNSGFFAISN